MAKKLKKVAKAASIALPRPVTSPYASPSVTLHFGPQHQTYYLPEVLLKRLENIPSRDPWTREINLVDVDANIGHVLIHFLHTGVYQTLSDDGIEDSDNSIVRNEFQKAVLTLEAAEKYSVSGLKELAQIELERRGKEMCLRDAVRAIREAFIAGPPDEHAWLRDYVSKKVQWTFKHDPSALTAPDFFESIESPTLTRLLARLIVGLYSDEVEQLREARAATGNVSKSGLQRLPSKRIAVSSNAWPASVEELGAFDDSSAAWDPHNLGQDRSSRSEASTLTVSAPCDQGERKEEALHTVEENAEDTAGDFQPFQPETVLSSVNPTKKKKKFKVKTSYPLPESPLASLPLTTPIPSAPPHDIQFEVGPTLTIAELDTVATIAPAEHQDPNVEVGRYVRLSKSQAKKLKAKLDTEAKLKEEKEQLRLKEEEFTPAAAKVEEAELEKIDEEEAAAAVEAEEAELRKIEEEEAEQMRMEEEEAEQLRIEEEKAELMRMEGEEAELGKIEEEEAAAAAAAAAGAEEVELRKIAEEEAAATVADWGDWRSTAQIVKDKKRAKKAERIRLREEEEKLFEEKKRIGLGKEEATVAAAKAGEAELKKREEEEVVAAVAKVCVSDFNARIEKGATLDDDDCGSRLEHLSRNEGWQNCKPCELYMRKIAIKLHSVGLPIVSGLSTID